MLNMEKVKQQPEALIACTKQINQKENYGIIHKLISFVHMIHLSPSQ